MPREGTARGRCASIMSNLVQAIGASHLLTLTPTEFSTQAARALDEVRQEIALSKTSTPSGLHDLTRLRHYDRATATLGNAAARASLGRNVHPDPLFRAAAEKCEQEIDALAVGISLDPELFRALTAVDVSKEDPSTQKWVEKTLREFRRSGVDRDLETREKITQLNEELVQLGQQFSKNITLDVRKVELEPSALEGLPQDFLQAHPTQSNGKVVITTQYPDYVPVMMYARDTTARELLWRAYRQRGYPANLSVLSELLAKRQALARLLGYPHWAAYTTENKMTQNAERVSTFIAQVNDAAHARARVDYRKLLDRKHLEIPSAHEVMPWDQDYLEDRIKAEQFGFDSQAMRPYFDYPEVKKGVMAVTADLFGIGFRVVANARVWHPDVETYDVVEKDRVLGRIYLDMHPREGKYNHAAQFDLTGGQADVSLPEGVLVCNFPKGAEGVPALMQASEVETFFHEFGHLLHHVFGGHQKWATISGIRTEWDFVEVPSMLLQEWASDPEVLQRFARHYQTKSVIPHALVEKLRAAKDFGKGISTRRQMFLSAVSLEFHIQAAGFDTTAYLDELQQKYLPFRKEHVEGTYFHLSFGHLEGYSAAYYTYAWSVVIAKDLLTQFSQGLMDASTAGRLRKCILEPGGSKDAAELVKDFLGREYAFDAYARWLES